MVEAGPRGTSLGPVAVAVLPVLVVAGAVADGRRGGAGHTQRCAEVGPRPDDASVQ